MFLYKLTLTEAYYELYEAHPLDARKVAHEDDGGVERYVSLGDYIGRISEETDIWHKRKYTKLTKIGVSEVERGVVMTRFNAG